MPTIIPTPPAVPNRLEGATAFNAKAGPFADWLTLLAPALMSLGQDVTDQVGQAAIFAQAALAAGAAGISTSSTSLTIGRGTRSLGVQTGKLYAPGMPLTVARTSAASASQMRGTCTSYNSGTGALEVDVQGITGTGTYTDWTVSIGTFDPATGAAYEPRATAVTLVQGDSGKFIDITAAFGTQPFDTPGNLGTKWRIRLRNSTTGDITIPASDGLTNWLMYPGEVRDFACDGVTLRSVVIKSFYKVFTTSGNFLCPPGYNQLQADLIGGGGGGSGCGFNANGGAGGGGGARMVALLTNLVPGTTYLVTVGSAGTAGAGATSNGGSGTAGGSGGPSSINGLTVSGGLGGVPNAAGGNGGAGGPVGRVGGIGLAGGAGTNAAGACAEWGGGSGGGFTSDTTSKPGGSSINGPGGGGAGGYYGNPGSPGGATNTYTAGGGGAAGAGGGTGNNPGAVGGAMQGGGGGGSGTNTGSTGGGGGLPGGGGGGGGGGANYGGAGGAGARGEVRIGGIL